MHSPEPHVLDDPVGESLRGSHAHLARRVGRSVTYLTDVATFSAVDGTDEGWEDLTRLLGPGGFADMFSSSATPPSDWDSVFTLVGRQMIWSGDGALSVRPGTEVVELDADDAPEMLRLVELTRPGPFWRRTHELGSYLGVRDNGRLVAMAGERLRPPGWTEISAVCTAPEVRGRGHAARLITALVERITARGESPFLHSAESNTSAIALYERLGFTTRTHVTFRGFRTPHVTR
ncbi:GNAT family N-acetyltransferase [Rhodococcus sp. NPDC058521]|uniref:GNAT family N-acetyltransferase n=1 Tax=Rhodococcus sp. NPDC058521 TaxID=3346536 RepID=UPI00364B4D3A